jgi:hypothetical protein
MAGVITIIDASLRNAAIRFGKIRIHTRASMASTERLPTASRNRCLRKHSLLAAASAAITMPAYVSVPRVGSRSKPASTSGVGLPL